MPTRIVEVRGVDVLVRRINQMIEDVSGHELEDVCLRGLQPIAERARQKVPVRTGYLRSTIQPKMVSVGGQRAEAALEASAHYAPYVEYGTRFMAARPYMRPAFAESHHQSTVLITGELQTRIYKNLGT